MSQQTVDVQFLIRTICDHTRTYCDNDDLILNAVANSKILGTYAWSYDHMVITHVCTEIQVFQWHVGVVTSSQVKNSIMNYTFWGSGYSQVARVVVCAHNECITERCSLSFNFSTNNKVTIAPQWCECRKLFLTDLSSHFDNQFSVDTGNIKRNMPAFWRNNWHSQQAPQNHRQNQFVLRNCKNFAWDSDMSYTCVTDLRNRCDSEWQCHGSKRVV